MKTKTEKRRSSSVIIVCNDEEISSLAVARLTALALLHEQDEAGLYGVEVDRLVVPFSFSRSLVVLLPRCSYEEQQQQQQQAEKDEGIRSLRRLFHFRIGKSDIRNFLALNQLPPATQVVLASQIHRDGLE
ncbi:hypothetical protein PVAG01_10695 [Phlyctema vagabunda]|uniref:Uncharacterized protein n=1 Tax=Phlyctema vagabunda TaxID=108571 RepID=A0ABR4P2Z6_9HELO